MYQIIRSSEILFEDRPKIQFSFAHKVEKHFTMFNAGENYIDDIPFF